MESAAPLINAAERNSKKKPCCVHFLLLYSDKVDLLHVLSIGIGNGRLFTGGFGFVAGISAIIYCSLYAEFFNLSGIFEIIGLHLPLVDIYLRYGRRLG